MTPVRPVSAHWGFFETPLGLMAAARPPSAPNPIYTLLFCDSPEAGEADLRHRLVRRFGAAQLTFRADVCADVAAWVESLQAGSVHSPPAINPGGTAFQHRVWSLLRDIPPGLTRSYSEIARALGMPDGARAVAAACAANPVALLIPCHRVVGLRGQLSGYRWGIERKARLLQLENDRASVMV